MNEKRFHKGDWSNSICEVYDGEEYIGGVQLNCADDFIDLLNELNDENDILKQQLKTKYIVNKQYEELQRLKEENEQLKQSVNNLKDTIIKITIAYQRKYDRNIVDLVHEVHDEDISDLINELKE